MNMKRAIVRTMTGIAALIMSISLVAFVAVNVDDSDIFELDGNPQNDAGIAGADWTDSSGPSGAVAKTFVIDPNNTSTFTQGGSKDTNGISQWRHTDGSVPDKDDIQNAFAAAYTVDGQLLIYFGADRTANNGDANIGFWFLQSNVGLNANGTFSGQHIDGDIFVVAGFTSGGQTAEIEVYKWVGNDATGSLQLVSAALNATCVPSASGSKLACAISNTSPVPAPWNYTPKQGSAGTFPIASFFEGGINVTELIPGGTPCFSTFIVETRSSTSLTAQLKDFVRGDFTLCGLEVTKTCNGNGTLTANGTILYSYNVAVKNTGAGTLYNVTVVDTAPQGASNVSISPNEGVAASLAGGVTTNFTVTLEVASLSAQNSAIAKGTVVSGGTPVCGESGTVCATSSGATCTATVSNSITITKNCGIPSDYPNGGASGLPGTQLVTQSGFAVVQVNFSGDVCNTGDTQLTGVTITDDPAATISPAGPLTIGPKVNGVPTCVKYSGSYKPSGVTLNDLGLTAGRYGFLDHIYVTGATAQLGDSPASVNCVGPNAPASCQAGTAATCNICPGSQGGLCSGN